ncbi:dehydrogenase/reductase SDR family member 12-like [Penaeus monodon]|uniref:dehydrogenase/reductase SDR family member 12-like n=1 Tax=Penaeus monodon TaxID=6687 RepID=UPI0018A6FF04|nr:dehydrogenase/reductase SDR family member 12-like [Penaeus monodon]XP_037784362.1 dehydrogenase/reductase SDR family member 12-like [Penaeus monodon]XP_037784363.1 dehydrogenase/reductase SDR family member 12-like [Penaeus monodon]XP_037784364.1 dehydrogenase/reductase SDR family member 12-like [Penaeus monodon]XP_037784365.1 dehydrogenase/reductase SDR family member 12-like [Penaeus monodon]
MSASSWYRRYVWNYKGNREYTKSGYDYAKTRFVAEDLDVDCSDRHYVITGSNSGIGFEIGREVARRGGVLHMVCRNFEAAKQARSDIITTTGNDKIHLHTVDLSRPREVLAWAREFAATHDRLHVLINNAGCMIHERRLDADEIENNFAVNTLAVHILVTTLLPLLQRSEDARVINVSSAGMLCVKLDPHDLTHENLEPFNGTLVYSQNKRQQVVMTLWYAQRYDNIHFSSMHPGWADTVAVRTSIPQFYEMMKDNLRSAAEGADTAVWLAISKAAVKHPSGLFFQDREPVSVHLPLAWTKSSIEDENLFMTKVEELFQKISTPKTEEPAESQATVAPVQESASPAEAKPEEPVEAPKAEAAKPEESVEAPPKAEEPVKEPKTEAPKPEEPKTEAPKVEEPVVEPKSPATLKTEEPLSAPEPKPEEPPVEPVEEPKTEAPKPEEPVEKNKSPAALLTEEPPSVPEPKPEEPQKQKNEELVKSEETVVSDVQKEAERPAVTTLPAMVTCEGPVVSTTVTEDTVASTDEMLSNLTDKCTLEDVPPTAVEETLVVVAEQSPSAEMEISEASTNTKPAAEAEKTAEITDHQPSLQ